MNPNSLSKRLLLVIMTPGTIYLSKGELMNIFKAYALIDIQNYTKREIEIIYGTPDNVTPQEFRRLVDKAIDKYYDWRTAEYLLHKYDDKGKLR